MISIWVNNKLEQSNCDTSPWDFSSWVITTNFELLNELVDHKNDTLISTEFQYSALKNRLKTMIQAFHKLDTTMQSSNIKRNILIIESLKFDKLNMLDKGENKDEMGMELNAYLYDICAQIFPNHCIYFSESIYESLPLKLFQAGLTHEKKMKDSVLIFVGKIMAIQLGAMKMDTIASRHAPFSLSRHETELELLMTQMDLTFITEFVNSSVKDKLNIIPSLKDLYETLTQKCSKNQFNHEIAFDTAHTLRCLNDEFNLNDSNNVIISVIRNILDDFYQAFMERQILIPKCFHNNRHIEIIHNLSPPLFNYKSSQEAWAKNVGKNNLPKIQNLSFSVQTCPLINLITNNTTREQMNNTLLLITFNYAYYDLIPYLLAIHSSLFPYITFCGPQIDDSIATMSPEKRIEISKMLIKINFIPIASNMKGFYLYECVILAIAKYQYTNDIKGILYISDDILLNVATLNNFDFSRMVYLNFETGTKSSLKTNQIGNVNNNRMADVINMSGCYRNNNLNVSNSIDTVLGMKQHLYNMTAVNFNTINRTQSYKTFSENGITCDRKLLNFEKRLLQNKQRLLTVMGQMKFLHYIMQKTKNIYIYPTSSQIISKAYASLLDRTQGHGRVYYGESDIFYIPKRVFAQALPLLNLFRHYHVMLEIAVPTILNSIDFDSANESPYPITYVKYNHYWNDKRSQILTLIDNLRKSLYVHPVKLREIVNSQSNELSVDILCHILLQMNNNELLNNKYQSN